MRTPNPELVELLDRYKKGEIDLSIHKNCIIALAVKGNRQILLVTPPRPFYKKIIDLMLFRNPRPF